MRANVEDRGMKGDCTPLMEAASAGHTDIVRLLIAHGNDVTVTVMIPITSNGGCTLLFQVPMSTPSPAPATPP